MTFILAGVEMSRTSGAPIVVRSFDPGPVDVRSDDRDRPSRDGILPGRDFLGGSTWAFDLSVRGDSAAEVLAAEAPLQAAWTDPSIRTTPGATVPLRYLMAGRWRRVYGRPRRYAGTNGDYVVESGRGFVTADFRVTDPRYYDDMEQSVALTVVPASVGGLVAPLVAPLSTVRSSAPRAGIVSNAGDSPTPLKVVFRGPVVDPWVRAAAGWEVGLTGSLAYDESVVVDARAGTVMKGSQPANGMLTRATRLSEVVMPAGVSDVTFGGTDLSGTATATLYWRSAYTSI